MEVISDKIHENYSLEELEVLMRNEKEIKKTENQTD